MPAHGSHLNCTNIVSFAVTRYRHLSSPSEPSVLDLSIVGTSEFLFAYHHAIACSTMSLPINMIIQLRSLLDLEGWPRNYNWSNADNALVAVTYGQQRLIAILLEKGCSIPHHISTSPALRTAIDEMSWSDALEQIVTFEGSIEARNCRGDTALHLAFAIDETSPAVGNLMERFIPAAKKNMKNCDGLSLLHIACAKSTPAAVQLLLGKFRSDIDCQIHTHVKSPYAGYTPLHFAVHHGKYEVAALLLKHGANLYAQDHNGSTPLHLALNRDDINMIDLILQNDHMHSNCIDNFGVSHFMAACASTMTSVVDKFLLKVQTFLMIPTSYLVNDNVKHTHHKYAGYTPLHFAVRAGNLQTVQLLSVHAASYSALTIDRLTPIDIARNLGFQEICQFLERFGETCRNEDVLICGMESMRFGKGAV